MILIYFWVVRLLSLTEKVLAILATRMERKYTKAALQTEGSVKVLQKKPGNATVDALTFAKAQYELGRQVNMRDTLEAKYLYWQSWADGIHGAINRIRNWRGRYAPYLFGATDVAILLIALHSLGLPHGLNKATVQVWADQTVASYSKR